jgi:Tol biopolymer transport system component
MILRAFDAVPHRRLARRSGERLSAETPKPSRVPMRLVCPHFVRSTVAAPRVARDRERKTARRALFAPAALLALLTPLTAAVPARATFPGSNGLIVFDTPFAPHSQIFTVRPDGAGREQLTHFSGRQEACQPAWSADGSNIVFVVSRGPCDEGGHARIWVMSAGGTRQHQITHDPGFRDIYPSWSPSGRKIVFSRCAVPFGFVAFCDVDVVAADGARMRKLLGGNWINAAPRYSPDGEHIAFSSNRGGFVSAVWVMNADGSAPTRLTDPDLEASGPEWSPDGRTILFDDNSDRPIPPSVWAIHADGTHLRRLTDLPDRKGALAAAYSPNGRRIVLISNLGCAGECSELYVMNADGTNLHPIVSEEPGVFNSDWQPKVMT